MKKFLLLFVLIGFLAPVEMASAATKKNAFTEFVYSVFGKKEQPQPKFRPQSKGVYKVK